MDFGGPDCQSPTFAQANLSLQRKGPKIQTEIRSDLSQEASQHSLN
jgi:hypothetical protein